MASPASPSWQLTLASVVGPSHLHDAMPNQDCARALQDDAAEVLAAAVADGAGSAPRSQHGATLTAEFMAQSLLQLGRSPRLAAMDGAALHDWAIARLEAVRQQLLATGEPLSHFHCTLVACVLSPHGRWLFQLGDSAALTSRCGLTADAGRIWFPPASTQLHAGSRGEYANETHFVTDRNWSQHLTVLRLPADHDAVLLMTDGAMDVAVVRGEVFPNFLPVVAAQLLKTDQRADRDAMLAAWLADPQTHRVTGDDKTLLMALQCGAARVPQRSFGLTTPQPPALPPSETPPPPPPPPPVAVVPPKPQPSKPVQPEPSEQTASLWPVWRWRAVLIAALCLLVGPLAFFAADRALQALQTPEPPSKPVPKAAVVARFEGSDRLSLSQGQSLRVRVLAARGSRVEVEQSPADLELSASGSPCAQPVPRDSQTDLCEFVVTADAEAPAGPRQLRLRVLDAGSAREQQLVLTLLIRAVQRP